MGKYWFKIALGSLAVFVGGYAVVSGLRMVKGIAEGGNISVPLAFLPFSLEGERLGSVKHVTIKREGRHRFTGVDLRLEITDAVGLERLASCRLTVDDPERIGNESVFSCASTDSLAPALSEFGTVTIYLKGSAEERSVPLFLPAKVVSGLREGKTADLEAYVESNRSRVDLSDAEAFRAEAKALSESLSKVAPSVPQPAKAPPPPKP